MSAHEPPVCGRCGVYRHLHPTVKCMTSRRSFWLDEHSPWLHVKAWLWIHVTTPKFRHAYCLWLSKRGRDWCELVDSWHRVDTWDQWRGDYSGDNGCLCDFPMPSNVGPPRPGWCYCAPASVEQVQP